MRKKISKEKNREYQRIWREKNRDLHQERVLANRKKKIDWILKYKANKGCFKCGEKHPACLDFHHIDPSIKEEGISRIAQNSWSNDRILKEIKKCEILCSNCHRKLHWDMKNESI